MNVFSTLGADETAGAFAVSKANSASEFVALPHTTVSVADGKLAVKGFVSIPSSSLCLVSPPASFNVSSGYANDAALTAQRFKAGAFVTAFKGKVDAKGHITLA